MEEIYRMKYAQYKQRYSDCKTVAGSYDKGTKSIEAIIPEGRMKKSGVRGETFKGYELWSVGPKGDYGFTPYRATCEENAMKQHIKNCKLMGRTPCDPPEGKISRIYR